MLLLHCKQKKMQINKYLHPIFVKTMLNQQQRQLKFS